MKIKKFISIFIYIMFIEVLFVISTTKVIGNVFLITLFSLLITIFIDLITNLFPKKINKIIYNIFIIITSLLSFAYIIYYKMYDNILTIHTLFNSYKAISFINILFKEILKHWYIVLILIGAIVLLIFLEKHINFDRPKKKNIYKELAINIAGYIVTILVILCLPNSKLYSPKNLYFNINNNLENTKQFGLLTTIRLDIQRLVFRFKENSKISNEDYYLENPEDYHILDIKLDSDDEALKEIYDYIIKQKPTNKNEYTGIFKNKNVIVFIAESFSNMAIRKDVTPTLYKITQEGINFSNYYAPLFSIGTSDSEYVIDTSLFPADGTWSMEQSHNNYYPYSYANVLESLGYKSYAYHDWDYNYYNRDKYITNMGYDNFLACGTGLEKRITCNVRHPSDYEMVKETIDDYINEDHFVAYYVTMSGHQTYDSGNVLVKKNWNKVKNLDYSDKAKAYLATQIELDKALEETINRLKEKGKLDDTVIIITGDHYPPGLTFDEMQELSTYKLDATFEKYRMPFIIYNSEVEHVDNKKYCSSLDILPTMLNMLGVEYDSRLLMGKDIFSDSDDLVIFSDRSFITNKGRYNELAETYTGQTVASDYISDMQTEIYHKFRYSRLILENDFYRHLKF